MGILLEKDGSLRDRKDSKRKFTLKETILMQKQIIMPDITYN